MKVVIQSDSRIWGGNEKWLLLVGQGLAERGHDIIMSCKPNSPVAERAKEAGLHITHRRPGGDADLFRALRFSSMIKEERPDAVLLSALKRVFWAGWAARKGGATRIIERLGIEHDMPRGWKYQRAFRHYVDGLIVNSQAIRDRWLRTAPWFPADEVHVVLNGVERPTATQSTLRKELAIPARTPIIAAAGRLEPRKGFDLLLNAFARTGLADAQLVIAGNGDGEAALRARADVLGISGRVHWLGHRTDLDNVLLGADIFVLPSRREGMANVMLEAMSTGCLIVATDISGVREAIGAYRGRPTAGWIVPVDNATEVGVALSEAVDAVRWHPDAVAAWQRELRYRIDNWFAPERTIEHTEKVLAGTVKADPA